MLLDFATNRHGATYAYFVCSGRATKKTACTRRAVPVQLAERLVADTYKHLTISEQTYMTTSAKMQAAFDKRVSSHDQELADLTANRTRLKSESEKLIAAHFADAIDLPTLKEHQDRIRTGLADIDRRLAEHDEHYSGSRAFLGSSLRLLTNAYRMYTGSNDQQRRLANQAFYTKIVVTEDEHFQPTLAEPFASITHHDLAQQRAGRRRPRSETQREPTDTSHVKGSRMPTWVDLPGRFSNPRAILKTLVRRVIMGSDGLRRRVRTSQIEDTRGHVVENSAQTQTRLTPSEVAELLAEYEAGMPVKALAARFGLHKNTVSQIVKRAGATPRWSPSTPAQRKHAAALYGEGYSLSQVAQRVGISTATVRAAVVAEGGTIRPKGIVNRIPE